MIVLASGSPRRQELLTQIGLEFEVRPSGVPEDDIEGEPRQIALTLAERKARAASADTLIVAADTVLDVDGAVVGKPLDAADAARMLENLKGRWHSVITAVALRLGSACESAAVETLVRMRNYSPAEIGGYVQTGEPLDKAGAYAIQGRGGDLVAEIRGCYLNVVGFPLCEFRSLMARFGKNLPPRLCSSIGSFPCPRD